MDTGLKIQCKKNYSAEICWIQQLKQFNGGEQK